MLIIRYSEKCCCTGIHVVVIDEGLSNRPTISIRLIIKGDLIFNSDMPDRTPRKLIDNSWLMQMEWSAKIGLQEGISLTYNSANKDNWQEFLGELLS